MVLGHASALFYAQKSKSTSGSFEDLSNLLLFFQERRFLNYCSLWVDLLLCCSWKGFTFYVWKRVFPSPLHQMKIEQVWHRVVQCTVPAFKDQSSAYVSSLSSTFLFIRICHQDQKSIRGICRHISDHGSVLCRLSLAAVTIHHPRSSCVMWNCVLTLFSSCSSRPACFQQLWFISSLMSRQVDKSPLLVTLFHAREAKRAWIASSISLAVKEKKRHLTVKHPAVSPIDRGVSPSLLDCFLLGYDTCRNRCTFKVWRWAEASAQSVLYILKWNIHVKNQINYWGWTLKSQRLWIKDLFDVNRCLINCYSELSQYRSYIFQADLLQGPPYVTIMFTIPLYYIIKTTGSALRTEDR